MSILQKLIDQQVYKQIQKLRENTNRTKSKMHKNQGKPEEL